MLVEAPCCCSSRSLFPLSRCFVRVINRVTTLSSIQCRKSLYILGTKQPPHPGGELWLCPPPTNSPFLYFLQPNKSNVRVVDECDEALAICVTQGAHTE